MQIGNKHRFSQHTVVRRLDTWEFPNLYISMQIYLSVKFIFLQVYLPCNLKFSFTLSVNLLSRTLQFQTLSFHALQLERNLLPVKLFFVCSSCEIQPPMFHLISLTFVFETFSTKFQHKIRRQSLVPWSSWFSKRFTRVMNNHLPSKALSWCSLFLEEILTQPLELDELSI